MTAASPTPDLPLGQRLNNPLNLERSKIAWKGLSADQRHARFATFDTAADGIRAAAVNLRTYYAKHKLNTVDAIVRRWAPSHENDCAAYVARVCRDMGATAHEPLDLGDPAVMARLVVGMMKVELGLQPYPLDEVRTAVRRAYEDTPMKPLPTPIAPPTAKVAMGAKVSALAGFPAAWILASLWNAVFPDNPMPTEVAMALGSAVGTAFYFAAAYLTPDGPAPAGPAAEPTVAAE